MNSGIISTTVVRKQKDGTFTVRSPFANFVAQGRDRGAALTKFIQMLFAYTVAQQRQAEASRGRGRPSKNYESVLHVQVQKEVRDKFDSIATQYELSKSDTIALLLECFELMKEEFEPVEEMKELEGKLLQPVGAR